MTSYGAADLAREFRTVRKNTIQIAEDIPAEKYSFKAAPGVKSVAAMLAHVVVGNGWAIEVHGKRLSSIDFAAFGGRMAQAKADEEALAGLSKDEIIKALRESGEEFATFLERLTPEILEERVSFPSLPNQPSKSRFEMLLSAKEHEMHHRAQLMLIERLLGIVPHLTKQREAMMAERQAQTASAR